MYTDIFLDLDDTVLDFGEGQKQAFFAACAAVGVPVDEADYVFYDKLNKDCWARYEKGEWDKSEMLVRRYEIFLEYKGVFDKEKAKMLNATYGEKLSCQGQFVSGAEDGVKYLKSKYRVHITSNGNSTTQRGRLKVSGLDKIVDSVFISDEIGYRKPEKEFFDICLQKVGVDRKNVVMIGDSPTGDMVGAKNAGIDFVLFGSKKKCDSGTFIRHYTSWKQICDFL